MNTSDETKEIKTYLGTYLFMRKMKRSLEKRTAYLDYAIQEMEVTGYSDDAFLEAWEKSKVFLPDLPED